MGSGGDGGFEVGGIEDIMGRIGDGGAKNICVGDGGAEDGGVGDGRPNDGGVGANARGVEDGGADDGGVEDGGADDGGVGDVRADDGGIMEGERGQISGAAGGDKTGKLAKEKTGDEFKDACLRFCSSRMCWGGRRRRDFWTVGQPVDDNDDLSTRRSPP